MRSRALSTLLCLLSPCLVTCGEIRQFIGHLDDPFTPGGNGSPFDPHAATWSSKSSSAIVVHGRWIVYLADESSAGGFGVNLNKANGDLTFDDDCAVLVDAIENTETLLRVDTIQAEFLGNELFLAVNERSDSWDWNDDGDLSDSVLLHYPGSGGSPAAPDLEYVDDIDPSANPVMKRVAGRLFYVGAAVADPPADETNLRWLEPTDLDSPEVASHLVTAGAGLGVRVRSLRSDEGLLILTLSELADSIDYNNDLDNSDGAVLALAVASAAVPTVRSTELALANAQQPVRARSVGAGDWLVAFLVGELDQGNVSLNDPVNLGFPPEWYPSNCPTYDDTDDNDQVLHFLEHAAWVADPVAAPPQNTGLVGAGKVLAVPGFVATLALEGDDGACDLNDDGDTLDAIFRWVSIATPLEPFVDEDQLLALLAVSGGAAGATDLDDRFLLVVDENADGRNHDADSESDNLLLAWLDPSDGASASWVFDHRPGTPGVQARAANWLAERPERDRVLFSTSELVWGQVLNLDDDIFDFVPAWARFDPDAPDRLAIGHAHAAVPSGNAGVVWARGHVLYRGSEVGDGTDHQVDGCPCELVTMRTRRSIGNVAYNGVGNTLAAPAAFTDGDIACATAGEEWQALNGEPVQFAVDLNLDGDALDFVVHWFRIDD